MHGGPLADGIRQASSGNINDPDWILTAGPRLSAFERLEIYHSAYRLRLVECLADDYPALRHALGAAFDGLCREYISAHPSTNPNLIHFGKHLSSFCKARREPWAAFAADLAQLEWALTEVIHAAESSVLDLVTLQEIPPERWAQTRFTPAKTLRVLRFAFPVNSYFESFRTEQCALIPDPQASAVAVVRQGFALWRMDLTLPMTTLLESLCSGVRLGDALEGISAEEKTGAADDALEQSLITSFTTWVSSGFFAQLDFDEVDPNQLHSGALAMTELGQP